jgi:hypothetical protein
MNLTLHVPLLQSPEASIKSRGSRSQPPSSSQLLKRQRPRDSLHSRRPFHRLLLQIGGARSERLNCSLGINCSLRARTFLTKGAKTYVQELCRACVCHRNRENVRQRTR